MNDMKVPSNVRSALYIVLMLGAPIVAYLQVSGYIGTNEVALWTALTSAIALMARLNLTPDN